MIRSLVFSDGKFLKSDLDREALKQARTEKGHVLWVDLVKPSEDEWKFVLETLFQFHPLAVEDCVTPDSLPKVEDYEDYLFIVTYGIDGAAGPAEKFAIAEFDLFLGRDFVVTYHEDELTCVTKLYDKVSKAHGPAPRGPGRLTHALLDLLIGRYMPVVDGLRQKLDDLEDRVLSEEETQKDLIRCILPLRRNVSKLRAIIGPQRDVIERLANGESKLVNPQVLPYFRDLRDELVRLDTMTASFHERLMMAFDVYLNKAAFEANEGIKFLTALTAITLPAVLVGGWYGMNFEHMPELKTPHGYLYACIGTLVTTLAMVVYLKKKKWF